MKPLCEVIVQVVLPSVRALVAKNLIENYDLTQEDVAEKLGMSQPAISQYCRALRGSRVKVLLGSSVVKSEIEKICKKIASGEIKSDSITKEFCKICRVIREKDIKTVCRLHKEVSSSLEKCTICIDSPMPC